MKLKQLFVLAVIITASGFWSEVCSQRYLSEIDSFLYIRDTVRPLLKRLDHLYFSGYMQPQFQAAQSEGTKSFEGGDFSPYSKSRFMLRRARIRLDYILPSKDRYPLASFSFQVDATEKGVNVRDMFLRLYETKHHLFSLTTGLFARPFGYEVNLSSAFRESPERGRMSQTLMPAERDLGAMITFEPQKKDHSSSFFKIDAGFFNGQGLSGTTDFDSRKDFISRITFRPPRSGQLEFSGGLSLLNGGWRQGVKYIYKNGKNGNGDFSFIVDSSENNIGRIVPRKYYGADMQLKWNHSYGATEWRAEFWLGKQPGSAISTVNPGSVPMVPAYLRNFNGAFFYFLQNIVNSRHQLLIKYDWYDPNTKVSGREIGKSGTNLTMADIKFSTLGLGYIYYMNDNTKLVLYYDIVTNEITQLPGYTAGIKDNTLTCRLQFRF